MKKNLTTLLFGVFIAILLAPFGIQAAVGGAGLTISPPISDIPLNPGESVTRIIKINNPSTDLIEVYPRVMNFKAGGETGEPSFYDVGDSSEKFALASWISFDQAKLALAPEQVIEFEYKITVPADAEPGGHYGAVFFANEPEAASAETSKVSMGSMIGSLLLVRIPGELVEKSFLESFVSSKMIYLSNKVSFLTRISNAGNVHVKPLGKITIKNVFGQEVDVVTFNEQGGNVLPSSTRKYSTDWNSSKLLLGYYKADVSLAYGQGDNKLSGVSSFWVLPIWFLITVLILILILTSFIIWLKLYKKQPKNRGPKQPPQLQRQTQPQPQESDPKGPIILR